MKHKGIAQQAAINCIDILRSKHEVLATDFLDRLTLEILDAIHKGITAENRYEAYCKMAEGREE